MNVAANRLRERSADLRALARRIDGASASTLTGPAGTDTWQGPVAEAFREQARLIRYRLDDAASELRWQAQLLEERVVRARSGGGRDVSEGYLGFEPSRIGALARCVVGAIEDLDALWSADVLADDAIATARSISHTLSTTWMPVLVMLGADPSMREWDGVAMPAAPAPPAGREAPGRATNSRTTLGAGEQAAVDEVVATCRALLDGDDDPADAMYELAALLAEHGDDATVMHAVLVELGVDGFADVLMTLGTIEPWEDAVATAEALRDGLRYVDAADGYGADALAAALVGRMRGEHVPTGTDPYSLADFVMESAHRPAGLGAAVLMDSWRASSSSPRTTVRRRTARRGTRVRAARTSARPRPDRRGRSTPSPPPSSTSPTIPPSPGVCSPTPTRRATSSATGTTTTATRP